MSMILPLTFGFIDRRATIGRVLGAVLACAVAVLVIGCGTGDSKKFDAQAWRSAGRESAGPTRTDRGRMSEDLCENVLKAGMSRGEIIELLGDPDQREVKGEVVYYLGEDGSRVLPGMKFLILGFDRNVLIGKRIAGE